MKKYNKAYFLLYFEDNNCQLGQKECWCHTVKFTKKILEMVPE